MCERTQAFIELGIICLFRQYLFVYSCKCLLACSYKVHKIQKFKIADTAAKLTIPESTPSTGGVGHVPEQPSAESRHGFYLHCNETVSAGMF